MNGFLTVESAFQAHSLMFEDWPYGPASYSWTDDSGNLCIRYACGRWWHYSIADGCIVWW